MFHTFPLLFFFCKRSGSLAIDHTLSPDNGRSHSDNWNSTLLDCVWTAAKGSIRWTYMNVYGLLNCFRHTVRWALIFSKSNTASQGQKRRQWGATVSRSWPNPALSITLPHWMVKYLLKTKAHPLQGPVIHKVTSNHQLGNIMDYNQLILWAGYRFIGPGELFLELQSFSVGWKYFPHVSFDDW